MTRSLRKMAKVVTVCAVGLAGCQSLRTPWSGETSATAVVEESGTKITAKQTADVHLAMGRSLEKRGEEEKAGKAYLEAVKHDQSLVDAYLRLAAIYDRQGKFQESAKLYQKALNARPGSADVYCNMGYSLYLQRRWAEAEMNLRQAIAVDPGHHRAHNNLGLVLAHNERMDEALGEFHKGGCEAADAHLNVAFVLTLNNRLPEARQHCEKAVAVNPSSDKAKKRLAEINVLMAKAKIAPPSRPVESDVIQQATFVAPPAEEEAKSKPSMSDWQPAEASLMPPVPESDVAVASEAADPAASEEVAASSDSGWRKLVGITVGVCCVLAAGLIMLRYPRSRILVGGIGMACYCLMSRLVGAVRSKGLFAPVRALGRAIGSGLKTAVVACLGVVERALARWAAPHDGRKWASHRPAGSETPVAVKWIPAGTKPVEIRQEQVA